MVSCTVHEEERPSLETGCSPHLSTDQNNTAPTKNEMAGTSPSLPRPTGMGLHHIHGNGANQRDHK